MEIKMQPNQEEIKILVKEIVAILNPIKIILFGSAARGDMGPDSDLDVMVVVPEGTHRRRTAQKLYRELCGIQTSYDLVVATPSDLQKHKDSPGMIYRAALEEGKVLYAA
jgi:predicted nucleotidyltransferase